MSCQKETEIWQVTSIKTEGKLFKKERASVDTLTYLELHPDGSLVIKDSFESKQINFLKMSWRIENDTFFMGRPQEDYVPFEISYPIISKTEEEFIYGFDRTPTQSQNYHVWRMKRFK